MCRPSVSSEQQSKNETNISRSHASSDSSSGVALNASNLFSHKYSAKSTMLGKEMGGTDEWHRFDTKPPAAVVVRKEKANNKFLLASARRALPSDSSSSDDDLYSGPTFAHKWLPKSTTLGKETDARDEDVAGTKPPAVVSRKQENLYNNRAREEFQAKKFESLQSTLKMYNWMTRQ